MFQGSFPILLAACANPEPDTLLATGLYRDTLGGEIADAVETYEPRFPLWTDGAEKSRWILLPGTIDTSDPDEWVFPEGTRIWKEFRRDGVRIETRMLHKLDGDWTRTTYLWSPDQGDAVRTRGREEDALGTEHDVPSRGQCLDCHGRVADVVLGFSAVQLAHDGDGLTLASLTAEARVSDPLPEVVVPGDEVDQAALGYLHGNCGMCHHPNRRAGVPDLVMWLSVHDLGTVADTPVVTTGLGVPEERGDVGGAHWRISPGDPDDSVLVKRMSLRDGDQMPPLGTEQVDEDAVELIRAWIDGL